MKNLNVEIKATNRILQAINKGVKMGYLFNTKKIIHNEQIFSIPEVYRRIRSILLPYE